MEGTSSSSTTNDICVDDFYFSALYDDESLFPISDEKYAVELQLQEALISSALTIFSRPEKHEVKVQVFRAEKRKEKEAGESSQSFCTICMEGKPSDDMFRNNSCTHSFCSDCIGTYIAVKIQENITLIECPDLSCKGVLKPEFCQSIVPRQVFDRWENALCESYFIGSKKFYCPFKDCSAMLVDDGEDVVTAAECPNCRRMFCAQCKVAWHAGFECREFRALGKGEREREDLMVMELAKNKKWRRCPNCKYYVEKTDGCLHISCRCAYQFCYGCGVKWGRPHSCS